MNNPQSKADQLRLRMQELAQELEVAEEEERQQHAQLAAESPPSLTGDSPQEGFVPLPKDASIFPYGAKVQDVVSGKIGFIESKVFLLNGSISNFVAEKGTGAEMLLDNCRLKLVEPCNYPQPIIEDTDVRIGDLAFDRVTGLEGIVVTKFVSAQGCVEFSIQPQGRKKEIKVGLMPRKIQVAACQVETKVENALELEHYGFEVGKVGVNPSGPAFGKTRAEM